MTERVSDERLLVPRCGHLTDGWCHPCVTQMAAGLRDRRAELLAAHVERLHEALRWARTHATGFDHERMCPRRLSLEAGGGGVPCACGYDNQHEPLHATLAATPAQSLAEHDARIRSEALERAASLSAGYATNAGDNIAAAIRAAKDGKL